MWLQISTWAAMWMAGLTGIVLVWAFRLHGFAKSGEIYALYSASGEGMVGRVDRSDQPILFWIVVLMHAAILGAFWIGGLFTAFSLI